MSLTAIESPRVRSSCKLATGLERASSTLGCVIYANMRHAMTLRQAKTLLLRNSTQISAAAVTSGFDQGLDPLLSVMNGCFHEA
jgi:hypothetical protein